MEAGNSNRTIIRWKRKPQHRSGFLTISLLTLTFSLLFLLITYKPISNSLVPVSRTFQSNNQCTRLQEALDGRGEMFLWYAPHSGFSNQLLEFRNGLLIAAILNCTLIVPPVLDHHAVILGSCPKFRVSEPRGLRFSIWNHVIGSFTVEGTLMGVNFPAIAFTAARESVALASITAVAGNAIAGLEAIVAGGVSGS